MSTHNLCFGAKIRKIGIPLHTPVLLYKSEVKGGIHCMDMFSCCACVVSSSVDLKLPIKNINSGLRNDSLNPSIFTLLH